jgi:hypothetical protein
MIKMDERKEVVNDDRRKENQQKRCFLKSLGTFTHLSSPEVVVVVS